MVATLVAAGTVVVVAAVNAMLLYVQYSYGWPTGPTPLYRMARATHPRRLWKIFIYGLEQLLLVRYLPFILKARLFHLIPKTGVHLDVQYTESGLCLDVYSKRQRFTLHRSRKPVLVFLYGGCWIFGSKDMYAHIGGHFAEHGWVVVLPNYTLFPDATVGKMTTDILQSLLWVKRNIRRYRGNDKQLHVFGHSAGAHLMALTLLSMQAHMVGQAPIYDPAVARLDRIAKCLRSIRGCFGLSGVYDLEEQHQHDTELGMEFLSPLIRAMEGEESLRKHSPVWFARQLRSAVGPCRDLPRFVLAHGMEDEVINYNNTERLGHALHELEVECEVHLHEDVGHSDSVYPLHGAVHNHIQNFVPPTRKKR